MTYHICPGTDALNNKLAMLFNKRGFLIRSKNECDSIVDLHERVARRAEFAEKLIALDREEYDINQELLKYAV